MCSYFITFMTLTKNSDGNDHTNKLMPSACKKPRVIHISFATTRAASGRHCLLIVLKYQILSATLY